MFKNLSFVSLAFVYANLLGYIFHFYVSRQLSPTGYGEFMVLYSLMLTVGNISSVFTVITVKCTVENIENKSEILRFFRIYGLITGFILSLTGFIFAPYIKSFLKISYLPYVWVVVLTWLLMFPTAVERGFLQATERFGITSLSSAFELTIRLLMTLLLFGMGFYIWGAIFPSLFGIMSALLFLIVTNKKITGQVKKINFRKIITIALYSSPSGFFIYLDDIFIKRIFSPDSAGLYASASVLGKALILFSLTMFSVFFPTIVATKNGKELKKLCLKFICILLVVFISAFTIVVVFGKNIFLIIFGSKFIHGFDILPMYIIAIFPLTLSTVFIGIYTALEKYLKLIYFHLFLYLTGFIVIGFNSVTSYITYIFILNLFFSLIYFYLLFFLQSSHNFFEERF